MKDSLRIQAIALRKQGKSYAEILGHIPVAKSTLSLWLRSVDLSRPQLQKLTENKLASARRGAQKRKSQRIERVAAIHAHARNDIQSISDRELLLIGASLYWAEGSKEKDGQPGLGIIFSNADPAMHRVFLAWLRSILHVVPSDIVFEIYLHEGQLKRVGEVRAYWSRELDISPKLLEKVYFKKDKKGTSRKNVGQVYYGLLRTRVRKSSTLNRQVAGWAQGIEQVVRDTFRA